MYDPVARIRGTIPAAFFQSLPGRMKAAFATAVRVTYEHYSEPERPNMLGQARHALCEEAFRAAAKDAGLTVTAPHTKRAGGRYSLVSHEGVHLIRGNVQVHCGPPRPTRFRSVWAALNVWLDPVQLDLLRTVPVPSSQRLCGIIVVTAYRRNGDPSIPAFVGLGIPRCDLSGWVVLEPIQKVPGPCHDLDTTIHTPPEAPAQITDRAVPRLKKRWGNEATG